MTGSVQIDRRTARKNAFLRASAAVGSGLTIALISCATGFVVPGLLIGLLGVLAGWWLLHNPGGVPILVYHSVTPDAGWLPWATNTSVRPSVLDIHLKTLQRAGWTILATSELIAARNNGSPAPSRAVVLHFDDAYLDNYLFAVPLLRKYAVPATIFASVDFVAKGDAPRTLCANFGANETEGYMNAAELRMLDGDPLFAIEAHGTDHGRIPISEHVVGPVGSDWKRHAPLVWSTTTGDKSSWFRSTTAPLGLAADDLLPETASALAGRWYREGRAEDDVMFKERVGGMLQRAHDELSEVIGRNPMIMCWPFDQSDPLSVTAARNAGFTAVTGGRGENRVGEDPTVLSRIHIQDHAFGGGPLWLEALVFRAKVNSAAGMWVWHPILVLAARVRRRRLGASGYGKISS